MSIVWNRANPIDIAIELCSQRWTLNIMMSLSSGPKRFGELLRSLDGISKRTLTQRLRFLEREGVVNRHEYKESPPHVEYSLTDRGAEFKTVLDDMETWAANLLQS